MQELKMIYVDIPGMDNFTFCMLERSPASYLYKVIHNNPVLCIQPIYEVVLRDGVDHYPIASELNKRFWHFNNLATARKKMIELNCYIKYEDRI